MLSNDDACLIQASDVRAFLYRHMHPLNEKYGTPIIGTIVGINQAAVVWVHDVSWRGMMYHMNYGRCHSF